MPREKAAACTVAIIQRIILRNVALMALIDKDLNASGESLYEPYLLPSSPPSRTTYQKAGTSTQEY